MTTERKRRPWIGFLGMILILGSIGFLACKSTPLAIASFLLGLVLLIYALITGNVKFFG